MNKQALISTPALLLMLIIAPASNAAPHGAQAVTIINTGDRLTPGYRVTVQPSGALSSALVPFGQKTAIRQANQMIAVNRQRFFADLAAAEPLASLPTGSAAAPAAGRRGRRARQTAPTPGITSYPQVYVRYQGRQSPNLRAAGSAAGRSLYQDVKQVLQVLRLPIPDSP